jgi:hypothetical protein
MIVAKIYRRPTSDVDHFVEELSKMLAVVIVACSNHLVLCGDLNCGTTEGRLDDRLLAMFTEFGLTQYVNAPTRKLSTRHHRH